MKKHRRWISNRKNVIKVAIGVGLLSMSVFFFTRGCSSSLITGPGYETIALDEVTPDVPPTIGKLYPYYGEIQLAYYFENQGIARQNERREVEEVYNAAIAPIFRLLDSDRTYTLDEVVVKNIGYVNQHPNTDIVLEATLYSILKTAYQYMLDSNYIYNIYAGELEYYWLDLLQKYELEEDIQIHDPASSSTSLARLQTLVSQIDSFTSDPTQGLLFNDATSTVRFQVDVGYEANIKLDLQILEHAFALEYIYDECKDSIQKGYLRSDSGYAITLGSNPNSEGGIWLQNMSAPNGERVQLEMDQHFRNATFSDYSYLSYILVDTLDVEHPRHLYYSAQSGFQENDIRAISWTTDSAYTLDELGYYALMNMTQNTADVRNSLATWSNASLYGIAIVHGVEDEEAYRLMFPATLESIVYGESFEVDTIE